MCRLVGIDLDDFARHLCLICDLEALRTTGSFHPRDLVFE